MIPELETADFEAILAPLAGDQPTGSDLRQDFAPNSIYFRLRDARSAARDAERQAETEGGDEGLPALWRPVATLAISALKSNSKDLEVATWLTEALVRTAGLRGLMAGAAVIGGLVENFWDGLFPMPDDTGMETRLAAVAGLSGQGADGTLMQPLRKTSVFRRPDGVPFSLWQYQAALELSGISDPARRTQRIDAGVVPFEEVEKEARVAGAAHWSAQRDSLVQVVAAWKEMERVLDEKAGSASPSGNRVREVLELMLEISKRFAPQDAPEAGDRWRGRRRHLDSHSIARRRDGSRAGAAPARGSRCLVQEQRAQLAHRLYPGRGGTAGEAGVAGPRCGARLRRDGAPDIADQRGHEAARHGATVEDNLSGCCIPSSATRGSQQPPIDSGAT